MKFLQTALKKYICLLCSLILIALNITAYTVSADTAAPMDEPDDSIAAAYGTVLNNYINDYGVISTEHPAGFIDAEQAPNGLIYADIIKFNDEESPYLTLFLANSAAHTAECHIWGYNEKSGKPRQTAALARKLDLFTQTNGYFSIGWNDTKRYIVFKEQDSFNEFAYDYYTVIDREAFAYVNRPGGVEEAPVMHFDSGAIYSDVNITDYNAALSEFFDNLKNTAADSVSYNDVLDELTIGDASLIDKTVKHAAELGNFDIFSYNTMEEYEAALSEQKQAADFNTVSNVYALGDEMYYVRFSTDSSFYNYTLLRRTEHYEKYQILKTRMDCIPLSDRELAMLFNEYKRSPLLYKKAKANPDTSSPSALMPPRNNKMFSFPQLFHIPKLLDENVRRPAVFIGAAMTVLLITGLWIFMYSDDYEEE